MVWRELRPLMSPHDPRSDRSLETEAKKVGIHVEDKYNGIICHNRGELRNALLVYAGKEKGAHGASFTRTVDSNYVGGDQMYMGRRYSGSTDQFINEEIYRPAEDAIVVGQKWSKYFQGVGGTGFERTSVGIEGIGQYARLLTLSTSNEGERVEERLAKVLGNDTPRGIRGREIVIPLNHNGQTTTVNFDDVAQRLNDIVGRNIASGAVIAGQLTRKETQHSLPKNNFTDYEYGDLGIGIGLMGLNYDERAQTLWVREGANLTVPVVTKDTYLGTTVTPGIRLYIRDKRNTDFHEETIVSDEQKDHLNDLTHRIVRGFANLPDKKK